MHRISVTSFVSTHPHKNPKVRNGDSVRQKEEGGRYTSVHPALTVLRARHPANRTPAEKLDQVPTLPSGA